MQHDSVRQTFIFITADITRFFTLSFDQLEKNFRQIFPILPKQFNFRCFLKNEQLSTRFMFMKWISSLLLKLSSLSIVDQGKLNLIWTTPPLVPSCTVLVFVMHWKYRSYTQYLGFNFDRAARLFTATFIGLFEFDLPHMHSKVCIILKKCTLVHYLFMD